MDTKSLKSYGFLVDLSNNFMCKGVGGGGI